MCMSQIFSAELERNLESVKTPIGSLTALDGSHLDPRMVTASPSTQSQNQPTLPPHTSETHPSEPLTTSAPTASSAPVDVAASQIPVPDVIITDEQNQVKKRTVSFFDQQAPLPTSSGGLAPISNQESINVSLASAAATPTEQMQPVTPLEQHYIM